MRAALLLLARAGAARPLAACGVVCNVCSAGYGVPSSAFTQPVWRCDRCPLGFYSEGNTTTACSKCSEGLTTAAAGATAATECIPAVCNSLPPAVPGIPAWPASCNGTSSCTAECSGNWTGSVGVLCGPDSSWLPPKQTCQLQQPGPEVFSGVLSTNPTNVIVKSKAQILFTLQFNASLAAAAGPVKLFTCSAAGDPLQYLIDMEPTAPGGITYSASLALHGPQLGSLSSSPGVLRFTAVVGAGSRATGAVAQLELLPGCADGPAEAPPGGSRPWDVTACSASAVGQQCFTTCNWPAFDGMGYWVTCLPDGSWSGPGGFCFQMSCSGSPGPEWAGSGCTGLRVGSKCTVPCPSGQQGVGFVAECSFAGWQVSARDCSDVPTTCNFLPTLNAPAGSKGWGADCAGRANGETCQAACDGVNAYFGQGYSALCQNGEWTVLPSGGCRVCATSQTFAKRGDSLPSGTGGGLYGILPTNDGNSVLVVDQAGNLGRIVVYSARDLVYQTEWVAPSDVFALAQAPGPNGHVFASRYFLSDLYELSYPSGNVATVHNVGVGFYVGLAVDSVGSLYGANWLNEYVTRWDAPGPNFAAPVNLQLNDGSTFVPWGVAVDARTGNVLVKVVDNAAGGTGRVVAFNSRGTFLGTLIRGLPSTAIGGMAVDRAGNIYVTQYANPGQLRKYDSSGQLLGMFGKALDTPVGVAVGADGTVWVTEEAGSAHKITCL
ncbi:hypothetical protein OEZ85_005025 [Tetradesmus obliquus]|uniref:Tyrosine-protein kinase ephrin type A/B receptor-like domain-containing protein n=1 Tax=Tetradesmus obliquus TaxID=3088 RepID=A0ABY8UGK8_TETOB|nr:hypothetical protein OEZ85_005025 [Tetradesmus obliquus]